MSIRQRFSHKIINMNFGIDYFLKPLSLFFLVFYLFLNIEITAQPILWQSCIGGSAIDNANCFDVARDGSYLIAGSTRSYDIEGLGKTTGDADILITKVNSHGRVLWKKSFGGSFSEEAKDVKVTKDGGFIIVGSSDSREVGNKGKKDFYIVRIDALGTKLWEKTFGGSGNDEATSVIVLPNREGFIVGGETGSKDGDVKLNQGGLDFWVLKLNFNGELVWQKTFGGLNNDQIYSMCLTKDNNIMLAGPTDSNTADVSVNKGKTDIFIVKIDQSGSPILKKTLGGNGFDVPYSLIKTLRGELVMAGTTSSTSGDVKTLHGQNDAFIAKLDDNANIIWTKSYGGTSEDGANSIISTFEGYFVVAGTTSSRDGDLLDLKGGNDAWVFKVDSVGTLKWNKTVGGARNEQFYSVKESPGSDFIAVGYTSSDNADLEKVIRKGNNDFWIVAVQDVPPPPVKSLTPTVISGYVRDKKTKKFISAEVRTVNNALGKRLSKDVSDTLFGIYSVFLPDTNQASIGVFADGYFFFGQNINITPEQRYSEIRLDVELNRIELNTHLNLFNITFEQGSPNLTEDSKPELDRIVEFLNKNKRISIKIKGHTDGTGEKATKQKLSELRANAVLKYLVSKGIDTRRLTSQGYGMSKPIASDDTLEGQSQNRRVEIEVTKK